MPLQTHKGILTKKDGQFKFRVKYSPQSPEMELALDEIFEDFENKSVEITLANREHDPPIYAGLVKNWESQLETTPDPDYQFCSEEGRERFLDMKFGLMVHWGMYSWLGSSESWAANAKNAPSWFLDIYFTLWQVWNPVQFDAEEWANLVKRAGMQFIQITTKHHEGFALWDTKTKTKARHRIGSRTDIALTPIEDIENHFSVMDTPFKRDIIGELSRAFHKHGLGWGIYFSHIDWNDPNFRWDEANRSFDPKYNEKENPVEWAAFIERERQQLIELFSNYGRVDQIFFDGSWLGLAWPSMKKMVKELRKLQPHCMISDRGTGPMADFTSPERWIPTDDDKDKGHVKSVKTIQKAWQVCDPIGTHWSWVPEEIYKDKHVLLKNLISVVAMGGTYVFDQGPMSNGRFPQEAIDILEYMGRWLEVNGEAIYATRTWKMTHQGDNLFFTRSKDQKWVYAIQIGWPNGKVEIDDLTAVSGSKIMMLGVKDPVSWKQDGKKVVIEIPPAWNTKIPCDYAFAFKIQQK